MLVDVVFAAVLFLVLVAVAVVVALVFVFVVVDVGSSSAEILDVVLNRAWMHLAVTLVSALESCLSAD